MGGTEKKLDCYVVRDLLPSYIEELTEEETTALIRAHLEGCPGCREVEQAMRAAVPVERAPKRALRFLRRVKRTRLLAAVLSVLAALWCMWWLYDQAFHYANTETGRLAAVEDYIPSPDTSLGLTGVEEGTPLEVVGWQTREDHLFIFYMADNEEQVHGILHLVRGLNGKYQTVEADMSPSAYTAGLYGGNLSPRDTDWRLFYLAGYDCRDIYAAEAEFWYQNADGTGYDTATIRYDLSGEDFLRVMDVEELMEELGLPEKENASLVLESVRLFDKDGADVTEEYRNNDTDLSWSSGKSTAERFLLYVYLGIVALIGGCLTRYFLRRD